MTTLLSDTQIEQIAKTIFRFCQSRTGSYHDAEDLSQEIMLVACKSTNHFESEKAFYAFVWRTADNILRNWYRNQSKRNTEELDEALIDKRYEELEEQANDNEQLRLILRELTRLSSDYRHVTVAYYIDGRSVREIAGQFSLSESMVKYFLFQSRKHIKEGIYMEKELGKLSYDPVDLTLFFWGGRNIYWDIFNENRLRQNIAMACYYDKLTEEQLSLQLGVPTAYLENDLKKLVEYGLLIKKGLSYQSNIVILTKKEVEAINRFNATDLKEIAKELRTFVDENMEYFRSLGFYGSDMPENSMKWMLISIILRLAYVDMLQGDMELDYPSDCFGNSCFRFLVEYPKNSPYFMGIASQDTKNGFIFFWDVPLNGEMVHHKMNSIRANVLESLTESQPSTDNDKLICSELLELGLAKKKGIEILPNFPCLNASQSCEFNTRIQSAGRAICENAKSRMDGVAKIMMEHAPEDLADYARRLPGLFQLNEAEFIMQELCENGWLLPLKDGMLATTIMMRNA